MSNKVIVVDPQSALVEYAGVDIKEWKGEDGENVFAFSFVKDSFRKIMGKTLTIIDASIQDKQQNKAMKDLLRAVFNEELCFASEMGFDQEKLQKLIDDQEPIGEPVEIEEVLGLKN